MSVVEEFLKANETYAANFQKGGLPMPPARHVAVLTCLAGSVPPFASRSTSLLASM
jgi:carbonic anhydrase